MSIQNDALDALVALGHRPAEAKRMVADALATGANPSSVQELLQAVYRRPATAAPADNAQAVKSQYAGAYYEYLGGVASSSSAHASGQSELLQVARAVGPGLTIEEFEGLGKRVDSLGAQRGRLTNREYQAALWAIPDAFKAERKDPVHFKPLRDAGGKPVDAAFEPQPPKAIEGLSSPSPSPSVSPQDMGAIVRGAGSGAVDGMYDNLWKNVQAGEVNEAGKSSALLQAAKMVRDSGGMQSVDSLKSLAKDYGTIERGPDYQQQMRQLVQQHIAVSQTSQAPTVNVSSAITGLLNQPADESEPSRFTSTLDKAQTIADVVGVVDQTGITDLANAGVSLTRAVAEPDRAGEHLMNAGMRAFSAIPVIGDAAKIAKYGGKSREAAWGGKAAHHLVKNAGVDAEATSALKRVSKGFDHGGGINIPKPAMFGGGGDSGNEAHHVIDGDAADPRKIGEDSKQAARDIKTLGQSIETFLNKTGAAVAVLLHVGNEINQKVFKPVIDWFKQVDATSKAMLEDNRQLARFSGEIGAAMQRLDTERFLRDVSKAQDMGGSISRLAGAQSRSEQAQQDLTQPYQQLGIEIQAFRTEIVTYIVKTIDSIDFIGNFIEWWYGVEKQKGGPLNDVEKGFGMMDEFLKAKQL